MPIKYHYDIERNVLYETGLGEVTYQDFVDYRKELMAVPLRPWFKALADYSHAQVGLSSEDMWRVKRISDEIVRRCGGGTLAIVVSDDLGYGMARMFTMTSDVPEMKAAVFKSRSEACAWLGIDEP